MTAFLPSGVRFDDPAEVTIEPYGIIELEFESCLTGHVHYDFPDVSLTGIITIERVSNSNVEACEFLSE